VSITSSASQALDVDVVTVGKEERRRPAIAATVRDGVKVLAAPTGATASTDTIVQ
jgi:hypothetical protein